MSTPLIPEQRQQELMRLLRSAGVLSIRTLTELMDVSHMTVRRDIASLEEAGMVTSVQGGVRLAEWHQIAPPRERESRAHLELPRKRAIAEAASALVEDGMVVFLDAGTTCEAIVPFLAAYTELTVVTNDFFTVKALFDYPSIETIHTGGAVDVSSGSSSGPLAAATVQSINLDLTFLSTGSWDIEHGVTTPQTDKVTLKQAAMTAATDTVLLADSTKFGAFERFKVMPLTRLSRIITDTELPTSVAENIHDAGTRVDRAPLRATP